MSQSVTATAFAIAMLLASSLASAGPPYTTDDPEPVEHRHWELYLASQSFHDRDGRTGTAPHVEVNYGVVPDVQLHVIAPLAYSVPDNGPSAYGYGDTELGIKYRFVQEQKWVPIIGTFPLLEAPSGARSRGLGNGSAQVLVPVWLQKSFGPWTTYGGAGVWIDAGDRDRHWWTSVGRSSAESARASRSAPRSFTRHPGSTVAKATRASTSAP